MVELINLNGEFSRRWNKGKLKSSISD